ncbi:ABC-F family ATP-binding cassette domain-containing protein [Prosthecomicrobium pneumaticum]|uniref:ATP-binding protein Uup n=1 Tax=Prosthecomicrobium pneumaticum TaxID=81895 RepID=A0A7W9CTS1_9HYPH|nr:ATP-binding cassette domain-containing protein [Prosthecomicrobium pneumaticum]MBB5751740.1 ATP-binding cassette subfamily F protein uup [Prosthecomicrobium pneumaticum]
MAPPLLHLRDIGLTFGGRPLLEDAELAVGAGERLCLVGRNGSGKSTLLKIAAGLVEADRGTRFVQPGTTVRYLPQEPDLSGFADVRAYVEAGLGPGDDPHRATLLIEALGLTGAETPERLSGGEARRAALARAIAPEPDLLLLDEPTNHLDLPAIEWLEEELRGSRSALVLISHDRRFLERLSKATVWLDRGRTRRLDRGFSAFEDWRDQVLEEEARERERLDRRISQELDWVRYGVTARRKRNMGRLRKLEGLRAERRDQRRAVGTVRMAASEGAVSGKLVVEAEGIGKRFGDRAVVEDFSIRIGRGDRVALVGPNGAGKTTLLSMLTGALAPDTGSVRLGTNLEIVTLDQRRESLSPTATVADTLTEGRGDTVIVNGEARHVVGYMRDFLFTPEQARTPVSALSGGERGRLMLARALARPSNMLVLDEPTNDLDIETLDLLEELLDDYAGTILLVSHDRDFLDRVATSVVLAEGAGRWTDYAGGYSDMVAQRKAPAFQPAKAAAAGVTARPGPVERAAAPKRKLSFKEKHALETLPKRIDALAAEIAKLTSKLAEPDLFSRDRKAFETATARLAAAETERAAAEEEWLTLEMLREELEG